MFQAKILDMFTRVQKNGGVKTTLFLNPHQCDLAVGILNRQGCTNYRLFGGDTDNERNMLGIGDWDIPLGDAVFGAVAIAYTFRSVDKLSHRDFLGCFMSCQISRELVGDILVGQGKALAFVHKHAMDILLDLKKIGNVGVTGQIVHDFSQFSPTTESQSLTIASARLDALLAAVLGKSRAQAVVLIEGKQVFVNHRQITSQNFQPKQGDVISARGFGKFIFDGVNHTTKKGRLAVNITKYV